MRWLLSLVIMFGSLALMGGNCGQSIDGGAGDGGAGNGGGGNGGTAGSAGNAGSGGSVAANDCGYMTTCEPGGLDACEALCDDLCEGGLDDIFADVCLDDARCWCWCATGVCSDDDCIQPPACDFENEETFCENACTNICDGADDVREAFCDGPGDTGYCECRCKVGGSVSCSDNF
jgi:hypothetical protein